MTPKTILGFSGLDVRKSRESSDPTTARVATNVDLTLGEEFKTRDGVRELMDLHPQSKGLYVVGGVLRSVIPGGRFFPTEEVGPVLVKYDQLGFGNGFFSSIMMSMQQGTNIATIDNGDWPANSAGRSLTVDSQVFTVLSVTGKDATLSAVFTGLSNRYTFVLSGFPLLTPRTITMINGTDIITLNGGVWPPGIEGSNLSVLRNGFSCSIVALLTTTTLRVSPSLSTGTITDVEFQVNGIATDYPLDTLVGVPAHVAVGAAAGFGSYPYLVVERWLDANDHAQGTTFEHHWITKAPNDGDTVLETQVILPFSPGPSLIQMSGKLWAVDDVNGVVRFSSTANGPRDWITPEDAGFIPVITHTDGDLRIQGLGIYDEKLAVVFSDAVQLWATDPQPSNIALVRVMDGPGTEEQKSIVNVLGDLFYFTRGGFRSLHTVTVTGQIQEQDDVGGPIDNIAKKETRTATGALWSQGRGQYLCAFGNRVYAFKYSPKSKVMGWTMWELPIVVDVLLEWKGVLYIRSGNKLYDLNEAAAITENFDYEVTFNDFASKDAGRFKRLDFIGVSQSGTTSVRCYLSPSSDTHYVEGPVLEGTTLDKDRVFLGALASTFGMSFRGKPPWTLSSFQLTYINLAW